jgi:general secretion pathway protein G
MTIAKYRKPLSVRPVRSAFTLIELLLVMMILAILAAVVVPKFTSRMGDTQIKAAQAQISLFKTALSMFEIDNGRYPTTEEGLNALVQNPSSLPNWKSGGYLSEQKVPNDPFGIPYVYRCPGASGKEFDLLSCGPDKQEGTADDIQ